MSITEKRPFPVSATVVMRSSLFALANMGAKLQAYNEETGVIVATVAKWMGIQKNDVIVRVREFEETSQIEVEAPDSEKVHELLKLIAKYAADGAKVEANATIQWVDMARQQASRTRRKQLVKKARNLLPGGTNSSETAVTTTESDEADGSLLPVLTESGVQPVAIPANPGVLVKNRDDKLIELKIDPQTFVDRTSFLETCNACGTLSLRGSKYCSTCGRPLTLEAIQPELRDNTQKSAGAAFTSGLIGLALNVVPLLVLILPLLLATAETPFLTRLGESLTPLNLALSFIFGIAPAIFFGWRATRQAQQASWYLNLSARVDDAGRTQSTLGNALGWLVIYLALAWIILIVIALL